MLNLQHDKMQTYFSNMEINAIESQFISIHEIPKLRFRWRKTSEQTKNASPDTLERKRLTKITINELYLVKIKRLNGQLVTVSQIYQNITN